MKSGIWLCAALVASMLVSGCQWVDLTPEGERIRVLKPSDIGECKKVGITTVSVKASVLTIDRGEGKVERELQYLARNAAKDLGGDSVVPASKVANGSQVYDVYSCIKK